MIPTSPDIARAIERAEAHHLRLQVETWRALQGNDAHVVEIGGGVAAFTEPLFGRKLNHVTGLGLDEPVDPGALAALEAAYAVRGLGVEIDLCPHAVPSLLPLLAARAYAVNAFSNTYVRTLDDVEPPGRAAGCALAVVMARPANTSGRNAERAGFRLAFTKATFARPHLTQGH